MAKKKKHPRSITGKKEHNDGGFDFSIRQCKKGERRAGMWTLIINGQETLFYSSNKEGIARLVSRLMKGPTPGTVTLNVMRGSGKKPEDKGKASQEQENPQQPEWISLPTREARVNAFLTRGKLAEK